MEGRPQLGCFELERASIHAEELKSPEDAMILAVQHFSLLSYAFCPDDAWCKLS
jgi:hypothetical protein